MRKGEVKLVTLRPGLEKISKDNGSYLRNSRQFFKRYKSSDVGIACF